ncbi:MAG: type II toxin-antitoxin system RelE family toxin [Burkholderiales bacterium]
MQRYRLQFLAAAKAEWDKLDGSLQLQFTKVLARRLESPRVPAAALAGMPDCYKIKLRASGYRLVYQVRDATLVLLTVAVGKRERNTVYAAALARILQAGKDAAELPEGDNARELPPSRRRPPRRKSSG